MNELDIKTATKELTGALDIESDSKYKSQIKFNQINFLDGDFWTWDILKGYFHNNVLPSPKEKFEIDEIPRWDDKFFLAHSRDTIIGKPQLVDQNMKRIPLVRMTTQIHKEGKGDNKEEWRTPKYVFFDERYDKRYDGALIDTFAQDFWTYKIETKEGLIYYLWSKEKLPTCSCEIKGMIVELDDFAELSRSMKVKSLSRIFFVQSFEPSIKILPKEEIVNFTKDRKLDINRWFDFLELHQYGNYNRMIDDFNFLRSSFLLSGKEFGYPIHLVVMGVTGTKKSSGVAETTAFKFGEDLEICEGGSSRLKGLIPSFKENPAQLGFISKSERIAIIDELGKMIEAESTKSHNPVNNYLGELNHLLDHKKRIAGSGNSFAEVQATAKVLITMNPVGGKKELSSHVGLIDPTTMSRMLWWVQDLEEAEHNLSDESITKIPRTPEQAYRTEEKERKNILLTKCSGKCVITTDEYLTLYDSCNSFICDVQDSEVSRIHNIITLQSKEPMKSIWKPRGEHHIKLLIDGIIKTRCLFKDYDFTFTAKEEDYDLAERILIRMVKGWETPLVKNQWSGGNF